MRVVEGSTLADKILLKVRARANIIKSWDISAGTFERSIQD
ncbi:MAG: hypothetical protein WBE61_07120 [Nitrososphaeraceae archaeon]